LLRNDIHMKVKLNVLNFPTSDSLPIQSAMLFPPSVAHLYFHYAFVFITLPL
jgi:hypothetical protein